MSNACHSQCMRKLYIIKMISLVECSATFTASHSLEPGSRKILYPTDVLKSSTPSDGAQKVQASPLSLCSLSGWMLR